MTKSPAPSLATNVAIALNAVIAVVEDGRPQVLCVRADGNDLALPYGPFDPERHRTFEVGVREWVERQTKVSLGYVEQLYTFGDKGREAPAAALIGGTGERVVSVGYLALARAAADLLAQNAVWRDWYVFFPWEDWREGEPLIVASHILPALQTWIASTEDATLRKARTQRVSVSFGINGFGWEEERIIDRYELMYEAGIIVEASRDGAPNSQSLAAPDSTIKFGLPMISDHRRILATAIGRLRGKLKYRPVIFDMMGNTFTLLQLQRTIEAIVGFEFHKQNFRRSVEKSGFIENTGKATGETGGRPAALFQIDQTGMKDRAASGLAIPRLRRRDETV